MFSIPIPGPTFSLHLMGGGGGGHFAFVVKTNSLVSAEVAPAAPKVGDWAFLSATYPTR